VKKLKNIKGYINLNKDISLVKSNIDILREREKNLKEMIKTLEIEEVKMENTKNTMERLLKELRGVEEELAVNILVNGINPTRSVDKVAFRYDLDPSTIWKNYYPKVKKMLKEVEESSENPVINII